MWKFEKKSEILEENLEVWEKFGSRDFFGKFGESLEMRGKIGKHFWKFVKQFETQKNIRNLKKKWKFEKHLEFVKSEIDIWIIDLI